MLDAADIKRLVKMETVLAWYSIKPNRAGYIPCPFHKDKTPSLKIYEDGGWHCFGCGAGSDLIDFVMQMEHVTFPDACQIISDRAGLDGYKSTNKNIAARQFTQAFKAAQKQKRDQEVLYWLGKVRGYNQTMSAATEWTKELEEACEKLDYAEYRLGEIKP